jgi:hypothetical protein
MIRTTLRWLRAFGAFWWDFVVGDDWLLAVGVVLGLGAVAGLAHAGVPAWWAAPVFALAVLAGSLVRARARARIHG